MNGQGKSFWENNILSSFVQRHKKNVYFLFLMILISRKLLDGSIFYLINK
jgi:hypothetical protein